MKSREQLEQEVKNELERQKNFITTNPDGSHNEKAEEYVKRATIFSSSEETIAEVTACWVANRMRAFADAVKHHDANIMFHKDGNVTGVAKELGLTKDDPVIVYKIVGKTRVIDEEASVQRALQELGYPPIKTPEEVLEAFERGEDNKEIAYRVQRGERGRVRTF